MPPINHNSRSFLLGLSFLLTAAFAGGQAAPASSPADLAQRQVTAYVAKLADLHCTESVTQEKLASNGHVEASERAKYDYLIMMDGNGDDFQLNESRIESVASRRKPLPMLITNGFSTALLVFHPYYRDGFQFEAGAEEMVDGSCLFPSTSRISRDAAPLPPLPCAGASIRSSCKAPHGSTSNPAKL